MNQQQPGMQVAYESGLEHWDEFYAGGKEATTPDHSHYHSGSGSDAPELVTSETRPQGKSAKRKRILWIIGALVALIVILAAILGGVLGSRAGKSNPTTTRENTKPTGDGTDSDSSPTVSPTSKTETNISGSKTMRQGSSLAVTGWRNADGVIEKYLFFQSPQDDLYMMEWKQSKPGSDGTWKAPVSFNASAEPDTRLSVSLIVYSDYFTPQIELFYTATSSRLLGTSINDQTVPKFNDDSINSMQILTGTNSSLSSYWPWTIQQDSDGALRHVRNKLGGSDYSPQSEWDVNRIENVTAPRHLPGTSLAVVPMSTDFERIAWKAGYGVFYQGVDGRLNVQVTDLYSPAILAEEGYHLSWPVELPSIMMPKRTPIAAFSVARGNGDKYGRVNTYVLYIDEIFDINVLYTDTSGSIDEPLWKVAQPKELKGVDEDSSLACLTMATSPYGPTGGPIPLEPGTEETMRCYFVRDGKVMEVMLKTGTATDWSVVGNVPIP
ncbi:hypothetical protein V8F20_000684 [Naviculisporaceae sp. PSN 640]